MDVKQGALIVGLIIVVVIGLLMVAKSGSEAERKLSRDKFAKCQLIAINESSKGNWKRAYKCPDGLNYYSDF